MAHSDCYNFKIFFDLGNLVGREHMCLIPASLDSPHIERKYYTSISSSWGHPNSDANCDRFKITQELAYAILNKEQVVYPTLRKHPLQIKHFCNPIPLKHKLAMHFKWCIANARGPMKLGETIPIKWHMNLSSVSNPKIQNFDQFKQYHLRNNIYTMRSQVLHKVDPMYIILSKYPIKVSSFLVCLVLCFLNGHIMVGAM